MRTMKEEERVNKYNRSKPKPKKEMVESLSRSINLILAPDPILLLVPPLPHYRRSPSPY